jgi:hypothetical protein
MFIYPYFVHIGRWGFDLYGHITSMKMQKTHFAPSTSISLKISWLVTYCSTIIYRYNPLYDPRSLGSKTLPFYRKFMFIYPYFVHIGRWGFDLYGHFQQCLNFIVTALLIRRGNVREIQRLSLYITSSLSLNL